MEAKMNRRCRRCGKLQDIGYMHYSKSSYGWICNDRKKCTEHLLQTDDYEKIRRQR